MTPTLSNVETRQNPIDHGWLHAEPFRRQLFHVAAATGLNAEALAVVSRVPWPTVRRLMTGRPGRIRVKDARRLMALRAEQIRAQMVLAAEPSAARDEIERLIARGASAERIANTTRSSLAQVTALLAGEPVEVTWAFLWRARAAVLTWTTAARHDRRSNRLPSEPLLAA